MCSQSHVLAYAATLVLWTSPAWAQPQQQPPPGGQTPPPVNYPAGNPSGTQQGTMPGNPGAMPQDQQREADPYAADKEFVKNAAESSATEVQLGKLAQDKASSDAVKDFGKRMADANSQTSEQLKQAASALKIQVPAEPPKKARKAEDKLAKLSGAEFDRAYLKIAADEQKQAVKQFEREAKNGKAPNVKGFATKNLPSEQDRQKEAEELASPGTGTAARSK
jgi:putative membrane protein